MIDIMLTLSTIAAAVLNVWSLVPDLVENYRHPERARAKCLKRPLRQALGNAAWAFHGLLTGDLRLGTVAILGMLLAAVQVIQITLARRSTMH